MKPFDLEKAKAGHPVCTRSGLKARIICFDRKENDYPIVSLINDGNKELTYTHTKTGNISLRMESQLDLMMASEKKEGWVNIYQCDVVEIGRESRGIYNSEKEALKNRIERDYITTIKIEWEE